MTETAYRVRDGFAVYVSGRPVVYRKGQFISAADPIVRSHLQLLEPMSEIVEQTTASPGERRPVTRTKKEA